MELPPRQSPRPSSGRVERLDSLQNPIPRPPPRVHRPMPTQCIDPDCASTHIEPEDSKLICQTCGTVAVDNLELVTDVTFGQEASGRAVLHGRHVAADATHAKGTDGTWGRAGGHPSFEKTIADGECYERATCLYTNLASKGRGLSGL